MSDLISREEVIDILKQSGIIVDNVRGNLIIEEINKIPTAYDVDKVVEQLEHLSNNFGEHCEEYENSECTHSSCSDCVLSHGIKIVKEGAVKDE